MHFHVELIMPPTRLIAVNKRVGGVLSPCNECRENTIGSMPGTKSADALPARFDGSLLNALRECRAEGFEPPPDWLVVTLDCHN